MLSVGVVKSKLDEVKINIHNKTGWYKDGDIELIVHRNRIQDPNFSTIAGTSGFATDDIKPHFTHARTVFTSLTRTGSGSEDGFHAQLANVARQMLLSYEAHGRIERRTLIASCNYTGNHFFTVALNTEGQFLYIDTLGNKRRFENIIENLKPLFKEYNLTMKCAGLYDKIIQVNGSDCGVWTAAICSAIESDKNLVSGDHIRKLTKLLQYQIKDSGPLRNAHANLLERVWSNEIEIPRLNFANKPLVRSILKIAIKRLDEKQLDNTSKRTLKQYKEELGRFTKYMSSKSGDNTPAVTEADLETVVKTCLEEIRSHQQSLGKRF